MAIVGIQTSKKNPEFTMDDFLVWMPQFADYLATDEGAALYEKIYTLANNKIFYSVFGVDWELAMSYCIAHYITLIAYSSQIESGEDLSDIAGGGVLRGILTSASVGGFSKSYNVSLTVSSDEEALFWNQTTYGAALWALMKTKSLATMFVVTSNPIRPIPNKK